ncbi:MAG: hypothetical protein QOG63_255 [Thermoleophilaceae bacterium]|nr:hypothetical protein [Thermoleophilaceae bacterium]
MPPEDITGFGDLETTADPHGFVATLDALSGGLFREATRLGADALAAAPGDRVLDVGCGTGEFACSQARAVAPGGEVVGIDRSETMVAEARKRRGDTPGVRFERGEAAALPLGTSSFDAVHMERVLLYVDEPADAIAELVRVARPGARIALVEPDIGTWTIDSADRALTRRVLAYFADEHPGAWAGRRLRGLLIGAGAGAVEVRAATSTLTDLAHWERTFRIEQLLDRAVAEGVLEADERAAWWRELETASESGRFFWSVTLFAVAARAP